MGSLNSPVAAASPPSASELLSPSVEPVLSELSELWLLPSAVLEPDSPPQAARDSTIARHSRMAMVFFKLFIVGFLLN